MGCGFGVLPLLLLLLLLLLPLLRRLLPRLLLLRCCWSSSCMCSGVGSVPRYAQARQGVDSLPRWAQRELRDSHRTAEPDTSLQIGEVPVLEDHMRIPFSVYCAFFGFGPFRELRLRDSGLMRLGGARALMPTRSMALCWTRPRLDASTPTPPPLNP